MKERKAWKIEISRRRTKNQKQRNEGNAQEELQGIGTEPIKP